MFLDSRRDIVCREVWPVALPTGERMKHVTCADTKTGFYERVVFANGRPVLDATKRNVVKETGIVPGGIIFTKSKVNMQGDDLLH